MDALKLKGRIIEKGLTMGAVTESLGIARSTLWRKMNSELLTIEEVEKLISILELTPEESMEIFFNNSCGNATDNYNED